MLERILYKIVETKLVMNIRLPTHDQMYSCKALMHPQNLLALTNLGDGKILSCRVTCRAPEIYRDL